MVIYEVNIEVKKNIYAEYMRWLKSHMTEMIAIKGFRKAYIQEDINNTSTTMNSMDPYNKVSVKYEVETQQDLDSYLNNQAKAMRARTQQLFGEHISITRRIYKPDVTNN